LKEKMKREAAEARENAAKKRKEKLEKVKTR
jgi:hypothetical protein